MEALQAKRIADLEEAPTNFKLEKGNVTTGYRMLGTNLKDLKKEQMSFNTVIPRSEKEGTKPPYVCPGCSNHMHGNNMINKCNVIIKRVIFLT
jgi:hypothetical protein